MSLFTTASAPITQCLPIPHPMIHTFLPTHVYSSISTLFSFSIPCLMQGISMFTYLWVLSAIKYIIGNHDTPLRSVTEERAAISDKRPIFTSSSNTKRGISVCSFSGFITNNHAKCSILQFFPRKMYLGFFIRREVRIVPFPNARKKGLKSNR